MKRIDVILDCNPDELYLQADGFDEAILGTNGDILVYSMSKIIKVLMRNMAYMDAMEHFYYNIEGSYVGEKTPIFVDDTMFD